MGFTTGFTGGITVTLSLAYLTVLAHQRNRDRQSAVLRQQITLISGLTDPLPPVHPPTRAEIVAIQRANLVESAKDRWNAEVEGAVKWVQKTDWDATREGLEIAVGRLWAHAFGKASQEAEKGEHKVEAEFAKAKYLAGVEVRGAEKRVKGIAEEAKSAAGEKARSVAASAKSAYADAKTRGLEAVSKGEQKAEETKGSVFGVIGQGIQKGKEALGIVQVKVVGAEEEVDAKIDEKLGLVERTLQQRYERPGKVNKSVEQALAERYEPVSKKENAVLRGV
ncbi:uncharacterized protein BCR38DRAFT_351245 [Pseudomassariella vexata]|uniref:MICOS complex subunit MIC12 n=1 Tax=Pseudomassariella vexata TaxID=1141098 RepID=A0A1Y2DLH0_9PEZI|nr:uncharacterized protein BCR38DRAFT_351245 [Pseudomassariella vexata]ORY59575.1 hypothetical protein BCR38DRAFT_351245 [Pseudomassariella vexata]